MRKIIFALSVSLILMQGKANSSLVDQEWTADKSQYELSAVLDLCRAPTLTQQGFNKPADLTDDEWEDIQPYLMPTNHPIRAQMDAIFTKARVVSTFDSLIAAGFALTPQQGLHVIATTHPNLKGYVIKVYPDTNPENDWFKFIRRCKGALLVKDAINTFGYQKIFKVPNKWIYVLPDTFAPEAGPNVYPKHFVLVAEDMKLIDPKANRHRYHSKHMHRSILIALFTIDETLGLGDAVRCTNVPFCRDGKIAFVDTETWNRWPVWYHPLKESLTPPMRQFWTQLTANPRQN